MGWVLQSQQGWLPTQRQQPPLSKNPWRICEENLAALNLGGDPEVPATASEIVEGPFPVVERHIVAALEDLVVVGPQPTIEIGPTFREVIGHRTDCRGDACEFSRSYGSSCSR